MLSGKDPFILALEASDDKLTASFAVRILVMSISNRVTREDGVRLVSSNCSDLIEDRAWAAVNVLVDLQSCGMSF